jgi:hypothetical protein
MEKAAACLTATQGPHTTQDTQPIRQGPAQTNPFACSIANVADRSYSHASRTPTQNQSDNCATTSQFALTENVT